jgi:FkbH-like protein
MTQGQAEHTGASPEKKLPTIKCIVWDLDNTLWDGVLLEDEHVTLRPAVVAVIKALDSRGILHSIASKNDFSTAMAKLVELGISEYFLCPQIGWGAKSSAIQAIVQQLNLGIDTFAFVDDQSFEREEVIFTLPQVRCFNDSEISTFLERADMMPRFITDDARMRRQMYISDHQRKQAEEDFDGPAEAFLASLNMVFELAMAQEDDLQRLEELTARTHQLNTTGYTYTYEELDNLHQSPDHMLLVASLTDKYGTYGKIGLTLVECSQEIWTVKLLLMSCRVMSRGVGTIMMNHIIRQAQEANVRLQAEFLPTSRNRMMLVTYKFGGFKEVGKRDDLVIMEHDGRAVQAFPEYVRLVLL